MTEILDDNITEKQLIRRPKKGTNIIWLGIFMFGFIFKIMHWPLSSILFMLGASGLIAYNISCFLRLKGRHTGNNLFLAFAAIWAIYLIWGYYFNNGYSLNLRGLISHGIIILVIFTIYEIIERQKSYKN